MPNIVSVSFSKSGEGEEENPREFALVWESEGRRILRLFGHKLVGPRVGGRSLLHL